MARDTAYRKMPQSERKPRFVVAVRLKIERDVLREAGGLREHDRLFVAGLLKTHHQSAKLSAICD